MYSRQTVPRLTTGGLDAGLYRGPGVRGRSLGKHPTASRGAPIGVSGATGVGRLVLNARPVMLMAIELYKKDLHMPYRPQRAESGKPQVSSMPTVGARGVSKLCILHLPLSHSQSSWQSWRESYISNIAVKLALDSWQRPSCFLL